MSFLPIKQIATEHLVDHIEMEQDRLEEVRRDIKIADADGLPRLRWYEDSITQRILDLRSASAQRRAG